MDEAGPAPRVLLAHKRCGAGFILTDLEARGVVAVIPAIRNRKVRPVIDRHVNNIRNLVERWLSMLKQSRRLATRHDRPPRSASIVTPTTCPPYSSLPPLPVGCRLNPDPRAPEAFILSQLGLALSH